MARNDVQTGSATRGPRHLVSWLLAMTLTAGAAVGGRADGAQACQPVPGSTLEQFYPVMPGWTRAEPISETDLGERVSRTTVDFDRDVMTVSVELMDSCRNPDVLRLIRDTLAQMPPATPGTTQRYTTVNGFPAYEEFTAESGHGELHVLVADRFMAVVTVETADQPTLENAARLIPMQKLAALK